MTIRINKNNKKYIPIIWIKNAITAILLDRAKLFIVWKLELIKSGIYLGNFSSRYLPSVLGEG
jgi:hypothetical protein